MFVLFPSPSLTSSLISAESEGPGPNLSISILPLLSHPYWKHKLYKHFFRLPAYISFAFDYLW